MKSPLIIFAILVSLLFASALAQRSATVEGVVRMEEDIPENTRVGVHVVDLDGVTLEEVASSGLVAGTFSVTTPEGALSEELLEPFRGGAVPLPGLQSEYRVSPENANYARAFTKVYEDVDESGTYTVGADRGFISVAALEGGGFYVLLYVDEDVTLTGRGASIELRQGWNVFTVRAGEGGELVLEALDHVTDVVLDTF
jgi:hypothetical protein